MSQSTFTIAGMDCPTEEQLIRRRLQGVAGVESLAFDLMARELTVSHRLADDAPILKALESLGMGARRKSDVPADQGNRRSLFRVPGMCCPTEAELIRSRFTKLPGVEGVDADLMERAVTVTHCTTDTELLAAFRGLGMDAELAAPPHSPACDHDHTAPARGSKIPEWLPLAASGVAAVGAEGVAWVSGQEQSAWVIGLALVSLALAGRETGRKGWLALRNFTLNIYFLMSIAVIGAALIGAWPEAAMVTFLFALAERIEGYALDRARNAVRTLMELAPDRATVLGDDGSWREVAAATVRLGQRVRVRPGERVPLDGTVLAGHSTVNQAPITGESLPVEKTVGDPVFAGAINERGALEIEVTAAAGNTTLDRMARAVREAQAQRAPTQRFVDRFALYYTPAVVALALLVAVVPTLLGQPFAPWLYKALVLLVIACPCALVLSTPITVVSGLATAARLGILVKGGAYLEEGRRLKVIALDKTGTLTEGRPAVTDVIPLGDESKEDLLHVAASLNSLSEHPVAGAMLSHCATAHGDRPCVLLPVTEFASLTGRGVRGKLNGRTHYVGNHRLTEENRVCGPHVEQVLDRLEQEGKTAVVLTDEEHALGVVGVADTLRADSVAAVQELHALGVRTVMLTGDNGLTARAIAGRVGIQDVRGNLLPEEKLTAIAELAERYGPVGMVGDGINDAPALARASVGFAMGAAGTDTALETAAVALMRDDLRGLPLFLRLSRQTSRVLAQNIALAIGIKAVFFALAFSGHATLWMAVFADMGASLLVVFNGLRLLRFSGQTQQAQPVHFSAGPHSGCGADHSHTHTHS
jgi:Cd2+/Zn2+-exporting ATPase